MGGSTSKLERSSGREVKGSSSSGRRRRRIPTREESTDERDRVMVMAMKEAETAWRRERKRLKEEVKRLRKKVEEEKEEVKAEHGEWEWVIEQMCVERAVRDEAVERWKKLYLAIKNELDDLIQRTYGEGLHRRRDEEGEKTIQELRQELKVREETIERLKERIALMEKQQYGKEREIDILRQSLRIISSSSDNITKKRTKKKASSPASRNLLILKNTCVESK